MRIISLVFTVAIGLYGMRPTEYQVKSALIFNFIRFVEFREGKISNSEILLCSYKTNPINAALRLLDGRMAGENKIVYREIGKKDSFDSCSVLVIDEQEGDLLEKILKRTEKEGILTIGDRDGYGKRGVVINMFIEDEKVKFEINIDAAKVSELKISSRLLSIAKIVNGAE